MNPAPPQRLPRPGSEWFHRNGLRHRVLALVNDDEHGECGIATVTAAAVATDESWYGPARYFWQEFQPA